MECKSASNRGSCNCTYEPCSRKGVCCECIQYHKRSGELPACFFTPDVERTYDRSEEAFVRAWAKKRGMKLV
jgi:hypothetical protein